MRIQETATAASKYSIRSLCQSLFQSSPKRALKVAQKLLEQERKKR